MEASVYKNHHISDVLQFIKNLILQQVSVAYNII